MNNVRTQNKCYVSNKLFCSTARNTTVVVAQVCLTIIFVQCTPYKLVYNYIIECDFSKYVFVVYSLCLAPVRKFLSLNADFFLFKI